MGVISNRIERDQLKPGDHIYSWRLSYLYAHHGIYVGEGKVIHFTRGAGHEIGTGTVLDRFIFSSSPVGTQCQICGDQSRLDGIISSCIDCFLSGGNLCLFEYGVSPAFYLAQPRGGTCTRAPSDPPEDVLHRASFLLQNGFGGYNIFRNNCEDFAVYCKTGLLGRSEQATAFLAATNAVVYFPLGLLTTSFGGLAAVSCGMYCAHRLVSDIRVRRDTVKLPVKRPVDQYDLHDPKAAVDSPTPSGIAAAKATVSYGLHCASRLVSNIGLRRDVVKLPAKND